MRAPSEWCAVARWSHTVPTPPTDYAPRAPPLQTHPVFLHDDQINDRFAIWHGDMTTLEADVITNTTDETLTESNEISERIMQAAGPDLKEEIITRMHECRTGEVVVTPGFNLRCRHIIHTVSPKYVAKYHTAAESALHNCYKNVLYKAGELGARTLVLCTINTPRRNFPPDVATHVALRTVRRYLEQQRSPWVVVVACARGADVALLHALAPLYFPRSAREAEHARWRLQDAGGPAGEPTHLDRRIRIIHNPHEHRTPTDTTAQPADDETSLYDEDAAAEAAAAFARACAPDTQRLLAPPATQRYDRRLLDDHDQLEAYDKNFGVCEEESAEYLDIDDSIVTPGDEFYKDINADTMLPPLTIQSFIDRYERLLRRAKSEDLSEVSGIGCLYQSGVDRLGRPVVVFIGKWFPIGDIDLDKALLYLIKLLDPIVRGDYVIAYFHTLACSANHPPFSWLKEVYTVLPYKYKKNLKAFYIVHPTFWTKMMTWWFTTFMAPAIKAKVHNLPGVEFLYSVMARDQLEVPAFVTEYDMTINGIHYFQPDTNNT